MDDLDAAATASLRHMSLPAAATSGLIHALAALAFVWQLPPRPMPSTESAIELTVDLVSPGPAPESLEHPASAEMPVAAADPAKPALPLPEVQDLADLIPPASEAQPVTSADFPPPPPPPGPTLEQVLPAVEDSPLVADREIARTAPAPPPKPKAPPPSTKPVTPNQATTPAPPPARQASERRAEEDYLLQVIRKLSRVRYRPASRVGSDSGVVVTRITVGRDGRLLDVQLTRSSGSPDLDRGLLQSVREAAPFAPLPADVDAPQLSFLLPIQYSRER